MVLLSESGMQVSNSIRYLSLYGRISGQARLAAANTIWDPVYRIADRIGAEKFLVFEHCSSVPASSS